MTISCNLLNAVKTADQPGPMIDTPNFIPAYPGPLPEGLRPGLTVSLKKCSIEHVRDVFMSIEEPDVTPDHVKHAMTIGWFYDQIENAMEALDDGSLFNSNPSELQVATWPDNQPGQGVSILVSNLADAKRLIQFIKDSGEGSSVSGLLSYVTGDHGDPEPIYTGLDGKEALSHYYKFSEIVEGRRIVADNRGHFSYTGEPIPFDPAGVYNMVDNPNTNSLPAGSYVRDKSEQFDRAYTNLLRKLHWVFNGHPNEINETKRMMYALTPLAHQLLQLPIPVTPSGDESSGDEEEREEAVPVQVAGPSFLYRP